MEEGKVNKNTQIQKMRELAIVLQDELMQEKSAMGSFIFGSVATKSIHKSSDLDLAIIFEEKATNYKSGREIRKIDGIKVEIWRYSAKYYIETFETEVLRNKNDTWMWTPLWIEQMQQAEILSDPEKRLIKWKQKAENWVWRKNEINPLIEEVKKHLILSRKFLEEDELFLALIALLEATTNLTAFTLMKYTLLPSFRPKELSRNLLKIRNEESRLFDVFIEVNDIPQQRNEELEENLSILKKYVDKIFGFEQRGPRTELNNVYSCLNKQDVSGAWLSIKYTAYWLGFTIVNKGKMRIKTQLCNAENHIRMIKMLEERNNSYLQFYKKIHSLDKWDRERLDSMQKKLESLL